MQIEDGLPVFCVSLIPIPSSFCNIGHFTVCLVLYLFLLSNFLPPPCTSPAPEPGTSQAKPPQFPCSPLLFTFFWSTFFGVPPCIRRRDRKPYFTFNNRRCRCLSKSGFFGVHVLFGRDREGIIIIHPLPSTYLYSNLMGTTFFLRCSNGLRKKMKR